MHASRIGATLVLSAATLWPITVHAGGTHIHRDSILINGQQIYSDNYSAQEKVTVEPGSMVKMSFDVTEYEYGADQYKYIIFAFTPPNINVGRATLASMSSWKLYYGLADSRVQDQADPEDMAPRHYNFTFVAPTRPGTYKLVHHQVSHFEDRKLAPSDEFGRLVEAGSLARRLRNSMASIHMIDDIATVTVGKVRPVVKPTLYLRANDQNPAFVKLDGGLQKKPLEFSWYIGPEVKPDAGSKPLYRYRIAPSDDGFGPWVTDTAVRYHYLPRGVNDFQVQARLIVNGHQVETRNAAFQFTLHEPLIASPATGATSKAPTKATGKSLMVGDNPVSPPAINIAFEQLYGRSRALLIGMSSFDDGDHFPAFDQSKISTDVSTLSNALEKNGFNVQPVFKNRLTRAEIMAAIDGLINDTQPGDRLLIYISSHGFSDPQNQTDGYVAASDCSYLSPSANCIRLMDLQNAAQRALNGRSALQVLIAVDSCFSGLGVVAKSATPPNFARLAVRPGAYMLTAGMADQEAQIDPVLKMSTFTHFLAKGLEGAAAQFDRGGVITLTDLYIYVQYNVAAQTKSQQIPMLGRLMGDGEMLFKPNSSGVK